MIRSVVVIFFALFLALLQVEAAQAPAPEPDRGLASWYRQRGCLCAASTKYPRGTKLRVTHRRTKKFVDVVVNDYGPDPKRHPDRIIDLDITAFKLLASKRHGLIPVEVARVPAELKP